MADMDSARENGEKEKEQKDKENDHDEDKESKDKAVEDSPRDSKDDREHRRHKKRDRDSSRKYNVKHSDPSEAPNRKYDKLAVLVLVCHCSRIYRTT